MTAKQLIAKLRLKLLENEGGHYCETYRSVESIDGENLPERYKTNRCLSTAIYYLLTPKTKSRMHRIISDEIYHFYFGSPVEMLHLYPNGDSNIFYLGNDIMSGQKPQITVPAMVWQGCRLVDGGDVALLGTTVAPGFDPLDYEHGNRNDLLKRFPNHKGIIHDLTE